MENYKKYKHFLKLSQKQKYYAKKNFSYNKMEEKLKEIFYPMVSTKTGGMGLGLTIAQSIIMQNSGLIECSSKQRETSFTIVLPVRSKIDA